MWRFRDSSRVAVPGEAIDEKSIEVHVVHRPRYDDWSWPKGKTEPHESVPVAAVREVEEETGLSVALGAPLTLQRYRLGSGQTKEVHYWVGQVLPEGAPLRTRRPVVPASRREIDVSRWMSPSKAQNLLTRRGDRRLLTELTARAAAGTLVTETLGLLRHAKAVPRSSWADGEDTRPLTRMGSQQALDVVDLLSAFGTADLISSPWTRCVATVGPYASLGGIDISSRAVLTERAMEEDPSRGRAVVAGLVADHRAPTVLCIHRPTVPSLLDPLLEITPSRLRPQLPQSSPWLATAELLLTHVAHPLDGPPQLVGAETHTVHTRSALID